MRIRWRGLELPSRIFLDSETRSRTYGKFIAEPFERGFGSAIGNSLRRILLSSIEGAAVTSVKFLRTNWDNASLSEQQKLLAAGVAANASEVFVLWNIKTGFCRSVSCFETHFGWGTVAEKLIQSLEERKFLFALANNLRLTKLGEESVSYIADVSPSRFANALQEAADPWSEVVGYYGEYSSIPGVVEDVTEICLNLKSLILRNHSLSSKTLTIDRRERGLVTGADVKCDDQIEVVNKDLVLATMSDDVPFKVEMTVENGRGYVPAGEDYHNHPVEGTIPIDAVFSPVVRVRHHIEEARVGEGKTYDRLILEVWTDGTIEPESALVEAAKILRKHLNGFVTFRAPLPESAPEGSLKGMIESTTYSPADVKLEEKLNKSLADLNLSVRATNCLESVGIKTLRDLVMRTEDELLQVRNFGETTLDEVRELLDETGLRLGMRIQSQHGTE